MAGASETGAGDHRICDADDAAGDDIAEIADFGVIRCAH